ncbi:hypothetical protein NKH18_03935 [Streptomyces sp. M10(2022)]
MAVSYGGDQVYGLTPQTVKHLEEHLPVVVIDVGQARTPAGTAERFAELARSLGAEADAGRSRTWRPPRRGSARRWPGRRPSGRPSPAGQEQAHVARPGCGPSCACLPSSVSVSWSRPRGPGPTGPPSAGNRLRRSRRALS